MLITVKNRSVSSLDAPGWSEFVTGETTPALHPASEKNPAGKMELAFIVDDVEAFYQDMSAKGELFSTPAQEARFRWSSWPNSSIPKAYIAA